MTADPSEWVIACGMPDVRMVNLSECLDHPVDMEDVRQVVSEKFSEVFGTRVRQVSLREALEWRLEELG